MQKTERKCQLRTKTEQKMFGNGNYSSEKVDFLRKLEFEVILTLSLEILETNGRLQCRSILAVGGAANATTSLSIGSKNSNVHDTYVLYSTKQKLCVVYRLRLSEYYQSRRRQERGQLEALVVVIGAVGGGGGGGVERKETPLKTTQTKPPHAASLF